MFAGRPDRLLFIGVSSPVQPETKHIFTLFPFLSALYAYKIKHDYPSVSRQLTEVLFSLRMEKRSKFFYLFKKLDIKILWYKKNSILVVSNMRVLQFFLFFVSQSFICIVKLASMNSELRRPRAATICRPSLLSPSTSFPSSNVHSDSLVANGIFVLHWPSDVRAQQRGAGERWRGQATEGNE